MPIKFSPPAQVEEPKQKSKANAKEGGAAVIRAGSGTLPTVLRVGSALASGLGNKVPVIGTAAAGLIGGAGEAAAQMLENRGTDRKMNWPRVGIEAGLSAIPFGETAKLGNAAFKGAALAGAGVVGRKATDEDPETHWYDKPSTWDFAQLGLGAATGGLMHKMFGAKPPAAPHVGPPPSKLSVEDVLKTKKWKPEEIDATAVRADALGDSQSAHALRVAATKTNTGNPKIYGDVVKAKETEAAQAAKNAAGTAVAGDLPKIDSPEELTAVLNKGAKAVEELALRAEAMSNPYYALKLREAAVKAGSGGPTTSRAVIRGAKATEKATKDAAKLTAVEKARQEAIDAGGVPKTTYSEGVSAELADGSRGSARTSFRPEPEEVDPEAAASGVTKKRPAAPKTPVAETLSTTKPAKTPVTKPTEAPKEAPFNAPKMVTPAKGVVAPPVTVSAGKNALQAELQAKLDRGEITPENFAALQKQIKAVKAGPFKAEAAPVTPAVDTKSGEIPDFLLNTLKKQLAAGKITQERFDQMTGRVGPVETPVATKVPRKPKAKPAPKVPVETPATPPPAAPVEDPEAWRSLPEPTQPRIEPKGDLDEILERLINKNPTTGALETGIYDSSRPGALILQPKPRPGTTQADFNSGWDRTEVSPTGIKSSSTGKTKPQELGVPRAPQESFDPRMIEDNLKDIQDPLVKAMAVREMAGDAKHLPANHEQPILPDGKPFHPVPPELEAEVAAFNARRDAALQAAQSDEEARAIAATFKKEANELSVKLAHAQLGTKLGGGGSSVGFMGMTPDVLKAFSNNPGFAARLIGGGLGAAAGAAYSDDDPVSGAALGGLAGFGAPSLISKLKPSAASKGSGNLNLGDRLVNWQRFALLSNPYNLAVNTMAPVGGATMSSIEKILAGKLAGSGAIQGAADKLGMEAGDTALAEMGKGGLGQIVNFRNWTPKQLNGYKNDALRLIREAEEGRADMIGGKKQNAYDEFISGPAYAMTTGDQGARTMLGRGGQTEEMAREATLTNEPRYKPTKALANIARQGGPVARMALPFVKTAANALEGSFERLPIFGLLARTSGTNPEINATLSELVARQGMGAAVGYAAFELGKHVDSETSSGWKLPMVIANMAGQYGPLAAAAFAAGQASQEGDDPIEKGFDKFLQSVPLPTTETAQEWAKTAGAYSRGELPNPDAPNIVKQALPDNMVPRFLSDSFVDTVQQAVAPPKRRITFTPPKP